MLQWLESGRVRTADLDLRWARVLHRAAARPALLWLNLAASRLSGAPVWLAVIAGLALQGTPAASRCAAWMLATGTINLLCYWALKHGTRRLRPFERCPHIQARLQAPDAFSFPSGHTLHAVAMGQILAACYPLLALPMAGFALLVAMSRVVLGLHFPSDVLVGALLGLLTAQAVLQLN